MASLLQMDGRSENGFTVPGTNTSLHLYIANDFHVYRKSTMYEDCHLINWIDILYAYYSLVNTFVGYSSWEYCFFWWNVFFFSMIVCTMGYCIAVTLWWNCACKDYYHLINWIDKLYACYLFLKYDSLPYCMWPEVRELPLF